MKKKQRILFGLMLLLFAFTQCETEDEIDAHSSGSHEIIDKENQTQLPPNSVSKQDQASISPVDCLTSYAFNEVNRGDSYCFLNDGFDRWGWTNAVFYDQRYNYASGYQHSFPLLASAFNCDISKSLEIGYLTLTVQGVEGIFHADLEFTISDGDYDLNDIDLYIGSSAYPLGSDRKPTIKPEAYTYSVPKEALGVKSYSLNGLTWPANANFIARVGICPEN